MKHPRSMTAIVYISSMIALGACASSQQSSEPPATPEAAPAESAGATGESADGKTVHATFESKSGSQLAGTATLTETADGVKVHVELDNVPPGEHGAHVHEKGDCSAPDGSSAGGHFNPASNPHALPDNTPRHLGDLGNVTISADGKGTIDAVAPGANLKEGDPASFLGKAIIIHEKQDDGGQPTGNAGGRIGCAVIQ
jgi:superoxide dismutase, Cu-Zn family